MTEEAVKYEVLPATERAAMLSNEESIFFNVAKFEQAQRIARMFADSTMVPDHFRGNIGNCMIGLNYAARIGADPFMVLQTMYIVHGRPGVEAKLVEAVINYSSKYSEPLQYEWLDENDEPTTRKDVLVGKKDESGCQAWTVERKSGKKVIGPKITWALVKAEGWYDKPGPDKTIKTNKWRTMPEMMFYYRAASWFANKNCPELKLGMMTKEEIEDSTIDITPTLPPPVGTTSDKPGAAVYDFKTSEKEPAPETKAPEAETKEPATETKPEPPKIAAVLAEIKGARPKAGAEAMRSFKATYLENRDLILSLTGPDFDYAKGKWTNAGLSWENDFLGANPAQAATSAPDEGKGIPPVVDFGDGQEDPPFDTEETDPHALLRHKIKQFGQELKPGSWEALVNYFRGWETEGATVEFLQRMLDRCRLALDKQNAVK